MDQKTLARWLKAVIIGTGICGLVVFLWLVPFMGKKCSGGLSGVWQLVSALAHFSGDQRPALFRRFVFGLENCGKYPAGPFLFPWKMRAS